MRLLDASLLLELKTEIKTGRLVETVTTYQDIQILLDCPSKKEGNDFVKLLISGIDTLDTIM